ncbi:MFS transporter [Weeksella virosa]|uniref:Multidrug efflux pump Tap n=1 Tax=Weeksella virosa (strain ATCC 43766 / DSM 16922 / JCM 21250 / CCUG 30538 / CDC 9751 / IAM 14551 / NBRC 16016 / NCTC 11634 / CL345/78) TaxID=865938 RepID=F0P0Z8_WEEVC|nr:MFS transporter [Weeksella virosa]ADX68582.1 major facilitator superfamily MFS_1 [Weeksella virosa DSM 16922]SUP54919.1 enterobactin exporter EntS [Weeksella virosa]VEH63758.1 enterobactin exporter EntS [Weeksella virosa]
MTAQKKNISIWKNKEFIPFIFLRFALIFALFMQSTSVAYEIFEVTRKEIFLGLIGLFEFAPILLTAFYAGQLVDKIDKRKILILSIATYMLISFLLMIIHFPTVRNHLGINYYLALCYFCFFVLGLTRAFSGPALFALLALVVRKENYTKAIPISSSAFMIGSVLGPLAGGVILAHYGIEITLISAFSMMVLSMIMCLLISTKPPQKSEELSEESPWQRIKEGLKFIWASPIILAVLSLDMFAVFFGGAESLLPAFVNKVLNQGSETFGLLRSAHGIGSLIMLLLLSFIPSLLRGNVGPKLLGTIGLYGLSIISFGLMRNLVLCFIVLMLAGCFDAISMVIRQSILQLKTPENLKGRVSSVNSIFVSSSNELGALESGVAATILGLVPAIIFGGSMTILTVILIAIFIKPIRKVYLE